MITVVFRTDYNDGTKHYTRGQLVQVEDADARRLLDSGVVEIRHPHEPTETKGEEDPPEET